MSVNISHIFQMHELLLSLQLINPINFHCAIATQELAIKDLHEFMWINKTSNWSKSGSGFQFIRKAKLRVSLESFHLFLSKTALESSYTQSKEGFHEKNFH